MFVKFHSDTRRTYKGFLAKWQSTNVRVRTDPRHTSKATIAECVIVVRLARRNGNREFKKLRRQMQRKRHIEIELCAKLGLLQLLHVDQVVQNRRTALSLAWYEWFSCKGKE